MSIFGYFLLLISVIGLIDADNSTRNFDDWEENVIPSVKINKTDHRLSKNVIPTHYRLKLAPNIEKGTFDASVKIDFTILRESTETIVLHVKDLKFPNAFAHLYKNNEYLRSPRNHSIDGERDFLTMTFSVLLEPNNYTLVIFYSGVLNVDSTGFYRTWWTNEDGKKVWLAATNFKPTHARRAFPCFDEPWMKATFRVSIIHWRNYTALSNTPGEIDEDDNRNIWTNFAVTSLMSTYQVGFVILNLRNFSSSDGRFNIWTRGHSLDAGNFSMEIGQKQVDYLENYTGVQSPMQKMENIAVPEWNDEPIDNWGIVTYGEKSLLLNETDNSACKWQNIATIMAQKLANQWFGNLVTPSWWNSVWLSEGFANYFKYYITEKIEPTWRLIEQFVIENLQEIAFTADDDDKQHPMNVSVNSKEEIDGIFNNAIQSKAGCIIRMISHVLNETIFRSGVKEYLKINAYKSVTPDDLFKALKKVARDFPAKISLENFLDSWVSQSGYPVVTVTRNYTSGIATITQKRYLSKNARPNASRESWWIPINYATQDKPNFDDTQPSFWLEPKSDTTNLQLGGEQWIIFNKKQTGYYRVNYDRENWDLITNDLRTTNYQKVHVLNRAQLLDDSFNLVKSNDLEDYTVFLNLTTYLKEEEDYVPWYVAFRAFAALDRNLVNSKTYNDFQLYIAKLMQKLKKTVGFAETLQDDHITKLNRINVIRWACYYLGSFKCQRETHRKLLEYVHESKKISADLQSVVLCAGIRRANSTTWNKTFKLYETINDSVTRGVILKALGCSTRVEILKSYLVRTLEKKFQGSIRKDIIEAVYVGSSAGVEVAFDFIEAKYKYIIASDKNNSTILSSLYGIASRMTTNSQFDKLEKFIRSVDNKVLAKALLDNALVSVNKNIDWTKKYEKKIEEFLHKQKYDDTLNSTTPSSTTPSSTTPSSTTPSSTTPSSTTPSSTTPSTTTTAQPAPLPSPTPSSAHSSAMSIGVLALVLMLPLVRHVVLQTT